MQENNGKFEFIYDQGDGGSVRLTIAAGADLGEMLESFENFLRASGYVFDGQVDIILTDDMVDGFYDPKVEEN